MPTLNIMKKMILLENMVFVFRNYLYLGGRVRSIVNLAIFLSVILYLYAFSHYFWTSLTVFKFSDRLGFTLVVIYNVLSKLNTIVAIVLSFINAKAFKNYVDSVDAVFELCNHDALYLKSMTNLNKRVKIVAILCIALGLGMFPLNFMDSKEIKGEEGRIFIDLILNATVQYRFIMECVAFYTYIEVVVAGLQYLNDAVLVAADKLKYVGGAMCGTEDFEKLSVDLHHWGTVSRLLVGCSYQLKACFGIQIGLALYTSVIFYIILIYQCVSQLAKKSMMNIELTGIGILFILFNFIVIKILMTNAGQRARSEADRLGTSIAALRSRLVGIPGNEAAECVRAATALARRLRASPLRVRLLSTLTLQMALLAESFAAVANYTIVLLQFNHVV